METLDSLRRSRALTDLSNRGHGYEWSNMYTEQSDHLGHYRTAGGLNCVTTVSHPVQYSSVPSTYAGYSPPYLHATSSLQGSIHWPSSTSQQIHYSVQPPPRSATVPSQHRLSARGSYCAPSMHNQRSNNPQLRQPPRIDLAVMNTEDQDSVNRESMCSEPVEPPLTGYPKVEDFDDLMKRYVSQLSPKKQDKALIHARRASNIKTVLIDKKTTSVESAQFRFWVKKMFQLQPSDPAIPLVRRKICHEGKPVAIREKLFKILTHAHQKCQHGGRDKTSAQVRRTYSWVPKELISRFVKLCPTCQVRRGMSRGSPTHDNKGSLELEDTENTEVQSPIKTRRESKDRLQESNVVSIPMQLADGSSTFQNQSRWMTGFDPSQNPYGDICIPTTSNGGASSFPALNGVETFDTITSAQSSHSLSTINDTSPTHTRVLSGFEERFKQDTRYCYD